MLYLVALEARAAAVDHGVDNILLGGQVSAPGNHHLGGHGLSARGGVPGEGGKGGRVKVDSFFHIASVRLFK